MNCNHKKSTRLLVELQAIKVFNKISFKLLFVPANSSIFYPKVAARVLLLLRVFLIIFNTVQSLKASKNLKDHLLQLHHFEAGGNVFTSDSLCPLSYMLLEWQTKLQLGLSKLHGSPTRVHNLKLFLAREQARCW